MMQVDVESRVMGAGGGERPPAVRLQFEAGTIPLRELSGHVVARQIELLTESHRAWDSRARAILQRQYLVQADIRERKCIVDFQHSGGFLNSEPQST